MDDSTVPVTMVPHTVIQEPLCLARRNMQWSKASRVSTITSSLDLLTASQVFMTPTLSSLIVWRLSAVEILLPPIMDLISSVLARWKPRNFPSSDVTGFCSPRPNFLTGSSLKFPMMDGRYLDFTEKRQGKKVSRRSFPTPANAYPTFFVTRCKNIHSYWT